MINKYFNQKKLSIVLIFSGVFFFYSCTDTNTSRNRSSISIDEKKFYNGFGIGPVKQLQISEAIDVKLAEDGENIFQAKCITCHQLTEDRKIGPGLKGVTLRRRPEWIMNQMLNPLEMAKSDSLSKELLSIYLSQMTDMNLTYEDARNILEYFRELDEE